VNYVYFPLHPETPEQGISLQDLFGGRFDLKASSARLKGLMDAEGLPFSLERDMTYNSRLAQELAKWGEAFPQSEALNKALYEAYFVDGLNIGEKDVLLGIAETVGLPVDEAREVLEQRTMRSAVDEDWRHARSIGVTGVPTFAVGLQGVVGAQPYEQLAALLEHVGAERVNN
jgi:predicted DsbA family dithiol-disulfide isomerase